MKWFQLAKVGKYRDRFGKLVELTKERLAKCAEQYQPDIYQAPITVGHPESAKEPAWGKVGELKFENDVLWFRPSRLVAEFAEMVNRGMYTQVSAGFNTEDWSLTHVAFLGARPPAIKGLKEVMNVEFSEKMAVLDISESAAPWLGKTEFSVSTVDWITIQMRSVARMFRNLKNLFIEKDGQEKADDALPEWALEDLMRDPPQQHDITTQFSQGEDNVNIEYDLAAEKNKSAELSAKINSLEGENMALKNELAQLKGAHAKLVAENRKKEFAEFCDSLINQGKLAADQKEATIAIMTQLDNGGTAEFSDGTKQNALDVFKAQLESRTPIVEFSEIMTHDRVGSGGQDTNRFAALGKSIAETVNPKK